MIYRGFHKFSPRELVAGSWYAKITLLESIIRDMGMILLLYLLGGSEPTMRCTWPWLRRCCAHVCVCVFVCVYDWSKSVGVGMILLNKQDFWKCRDKLWKIGRDWKESLAKCKMGYPRKYSAHLCVMSLWPKLERRDTSNLSCAELLLWEVKRLSPLNVPDTTIVTSAEADMFVEGLLS